MGTNTEININSLLRFGRHVLFYGCESSPDVFLHVGNKLVEQAFCYSGHSPALMATGKDLSQERLKVLEEAISVLEARIDSQDEVLTWVWEIVLLDRWDAPDPDPKVMEALTRLLEEGIYHQIIVFLFSDRDRYWELGIPQNILDKMTKIGTGG